MAPIDDRRRFRDDIAKAIRQSHPGSEPSIPPEPFATPIQGRPGDGNPHIEPPRHGHIEATQKVFVGVWGVIAIMFGCASAGWTVHSFIARPLIAETVKEELRPVMMQLVELKNAQEINQRATEKTLAGVQTDIAWLKREQKVSDSQPIKPEKHNR